MRSTTRRSLVLLCIASALVFAPQAMAAKERSNEVASTSVAFEAGQVIPDLKHNIIKFRSIDIVIGEPNAKKGKQKVQMKMKVQNFGNKDHRVIITATLRDKDDKIVAIKTVKDHINDNKSETFNAKYTLSPDEVSSVATVLLEVSYLKG